MTDWGAHHMDIAQWAIGMDKPGRGPLLLDGTAEHPVPFKDGYPTLDDQYNCATSFRIKIKYPGVDLELRDNCNDLGFGNGILFEGTKGRFIVNRGKLQGKPIDELKDNPLPEDALVKAYKGKQPGGGNAHMRNFFECIKTREQPISDVGSHHRAVTTCHLANIAIRLGRPIAWNPKTEQVVGDDEANAWQSREQRKGYEIVV